MLRTTAALLSLSVLISFGCSASKGARVTQLGAPIQAGEIVAIDALTDDPKVFAGQRVLIEGTVSEVCQGSGCWALVAAPNGKSVYARSADESVLLPADCAGSRIRVEGELVLDEAALTTESEAGTGGTWEGDHWCPNPAMFVTLTSVELTRQ